MDSRLFIVVAFLGACAGMSNTNPLPTQPTQPTDPAPVVANPNANLNTVSLRDSVANTQQQQYPTQQQQMQLQQQAQLAQMQQQAQLAQMQQAQQQAQLRQMQPGQMPSFTHNYPQQGSAMPNNPAQRSFVNQQQYNPQALAAMQQMSAAMPQGPGSGASPRNVFPVPPTTQQTFDPLAARNYLRGMMILGTTDRLDTYGKTNAFRLAMRPQGTIAAFDNRRKLYKYPSYSWMAQQTPGSLAFKSSRAYLDEMYTLEAMGVSDAMYNHRGMMRMSSPDKNVAFMATTDAFNGKYGDIARSMAAARLMSTG